MLAAVYFRCTSEADFYVQTVAGLMLDKIIFMNIGENYPIVDMASVCAAALRRYVANIFTRGWRCLNIHINAVK